MADSTALLKRRGGQTLPGVRIPPSPFDRLPMSRSILAYGFFHFWAFLASPVL